jgi:hypothetical protein
MVNKGVSGIAVPHKMKDLNDHQSKNVVLCMDDLTKQKPRLWNLNTNREDLRVGYSGQYKKVSFFIMKNHGFSIDFICLHFYVLNHTNLLAEFEINFICSCFQNLQLIHRNCEL